MGAANVGAGKRARRSRPHAPNSLPRAPPSDQTPAMADVQPQEGAPQRKRLVLKPRSEEAAKKLEAERQAHLSKSVRSQRGGGRAGLPRPGAGPLAASAHPAAPAALGRGPCQAVGLRCAPRGHDLLLFFRPPAPAPSGGAIGR